jgi:hypothetical protein
MGRVLIDLLPLVVGAGVVPIWIIVVLFLLRSEGGLTKAACFAGGVLTVRLGQGVLFGYVFGTAEQQSGSDGAHLVVSTLLLVVGILMLLTAVKKLRKEGDPEAPPPKWMAAIDKVSAPRAFGMGALLVAITAKQWVFTLSAVGVVGEAQLSHTGNVLAFLFYVVVGGLPVLLPVAAYAAAPGPSGRALGPVQAWLERYNRAIVIVVSLGFGTLFLWKGITGLLG